MGGKPPQTPHNTIPPRTAIFVTQCPRFARGLDDLINHKLVIKMSNTFEAVSSLYSLQSGLNGLCDLGQVEAGSAIFPAGSDVEGDLEVLDEAETFQASNE